MKTNKQRYIDQIRSNTAYPTYRTFVGILTILGYVFAGLIVLVGVSVLVTGRGGGSGLYCWTHSTAHLELCSHT
jgi:hypothetical protein